MEQECIKETQKTGRSAETFPGKIALEIALRANISVERHGHSNWNSDSGKQKTEAEEVLLFTEVAFLIKCLKYDIYRKFRISKAHTYSDGGIIKKKKIICC